MASRKGKTIKNVFDNIRGLNERWFEHAENTAATLRAGNVGIDWLGKHTWHEARRAKESIAEAQAVVDTLGATPQDGRDALRAYAEEQYGGTYDILAETVTLRNLLTTLQSTTETALGGLDGQGFIQGQVFKLSDTPPFWRVLTPAETAGVATALDNIKAQITD